MEVFKRSNIYVLILALFSSCKALAAPYNFPGPLLPPPGNVMGANDTFDIFSGVYQQINDTDLFGVKLNSGTTLSIIQGATLTYSGTNGTAATVYLDTNMAANVNINVNGVIDVGTAKFAIFSETTVGGAGVLTLNLTGIGNVNGDVYLNSLVTQPGLVIDDRASLNGNVFFQEMPGNVTVGLNTAHQGYITNGDINLIDILTIHTGIMQNNNTLIFKSSANKTLAVDAAGRFINNGVINNLAILDVTGALELNKDVTATTRVRNTIGAATIQTNKPVTVTTPIFNIQSGKYISNFNGLNAFGKLTLPNTQFTSLNTGTFKFMRQSGYLPSGVHILVAGNNLPTLPDTVQADANGDIFISSLAVRSDGNNITLTVNRNKFEQFARSEFNIKLAKILEEIGHSSPSPDAINALDWFESASNGDELNSKLNVFKMLLSLPTPSLSCQLNVFNTVANRLAAVQKNSYLAGQEYFINELWFRAAVVKTEQKSFEDVMPYTSSSYNIVFGIDSAVTSTDRLGVALSIASTNVKSDVSKFQTFLDSNTTQVSSFQATPYYLREFPSGYFVKIIAGATFNLYRTKTTYKSVLVMVPNINTTRSDVLFSLQPAIGTSFIMLNYLHVTASASLSGSYALRSPFNDQTIPGLELQVNPNSGGYITVSPRVEIAFPWQYNNIVFYPKIFAQYFYDLYGASHNVSAKFLNYNQSFYTNITKRKTRLTFGAALDFDINEEFSFDFNYDHEFNPEFTSRQFTLTVKYRF